MNRKAAPSQGESPAKETLSSQIDPIVRLHMSFGWWALLFFLGLGIVLETFHGLKIGWYLDVSNEARRLMWTLAHSHGTLFALVNVIFSICIANFPLRASNRCYLASRCLLMGSILMPLGFFLGGIFIYAGDPGLGVLLVPAGGFLLLGAVFLIAGEIHSGMKTAPDAPPKEQKGRARKK